MVIIERLTVVGVFLMGLALGYLISGSVLGPGVLAVLLGVLAGGVLAVMLHRGFEAERAAEQPESMNH